MPSILTIFDDCILHFFGQRDSNRTYVCGRNYAMVGDHKSQMPSSILPREIEGPVWMTSCQTRLRSMFAWDCSLVHDRPISDLSFFEIKEQQTRGVRTYSLCFFLFHRGYLLFWIPFLLAKINLEYRLCLQGQSNFISFLSPWCACGIRAGPLI